MPQPLLELGPGGLAWWQWIGLASSLVLAIVLGKGAARVAIWGLQWLAHRTESALDDLLIERFAGPLRLAGLVGCMRASLPLLELPDRAHDTTTDVLLVAFAIVLVWAALRAIDVLMSRLATAAWVVQRPASRAMLSLIGRILKVIVFALAVVAALGSMGLPIASLLAGLGIGGIALAFGAQKTVENLFGAFAIGVDQPLREGDFVRIESDVLGTVETVGLRSTRVRTLDRTIVTLPNGRLADMRVETFALRDRCRLALTIGLVYGTSAAQLREVLDGCDRVLRDHPKIWPDDIVVRFAGFGSSSIDIEIMAWFQTGDWGEFRNHRQDVLLGFMEVVERAGSSFAFPTRTIHVVPPPVADARPGA